MRTKFVLLLAFCFPPLIGCDYFGKSFPAISAPTAVAGNKFALISWASGVDATSYNVYFSPHKGITKENSTKLQNVYSGHKLSGLQNDTTYYFALTAVGKDGESALSDEVQVTPRPVSYLYTQTMETHVRVIADFNGDSFVEPWGGLNNGAGLFIPWAAKTVTYLPNSLNHGNGAGAAAADFNNDGILDLLDDAYYGYNTTLLVGNQKAGVLAYLEDQNFLNHRIAGYCESLAIADFNNDGFSDVFIPCYATTSYRLLNPSIHSYLLINSGDGQFKDYAYSAGVAMVKNIKPEAALAVDFNEDGWIDLYSGGNLFVNNGALSFTKVNGLLQLPTLFDEGAEWVDFDNDGKLDLALWSSTALRIFKNTGMTFVEQFDILPILARRDFTWGLTALDVNSDGWMDLIIPGDGESPNELLLNVHGRFERIRAGFEEGTYRFAGGAVGDFNGDYLPDLFSGDAKIFLNTSTPINSCGLTIRVTDRNGRLNQHGRVVRIISAKTPDKVTTRIVNGGSGYTVQNEYDIHVATHDCGIHTVESRLSPSRLVSIVVDTTTHPFVIISTQNNNSRVPAK